MFDSLLESRAKKQSRLGGSIVSTATHALLVGAIVAATATARVAPEAAPEPNITFTPVVPLPPPRSEATTQRVFAPPREGPPMLVVPIDIPDVIPRVNFNLPPTDVLDWQVAGRRGGSPDGAGNGVSTAPAGGAGDVFTRESVDRIVAMLPGSTGPRYPDMLRAAGIEGEVMAQFVVDTSGRADAATLRILQSAHPLFAEAVRSALPRLHFAPAEVRGGKVRQLVQQPFRFGLDRD